MDQGLTRNQPFPTTRWTLIARAAGAEPEQREQALEELCQSYWPPIYAFIRSKGASVSEAEDLTQGFFADILSRDDLAKADQDRGKLRSFLLRAVSNFMAKDWRARTRQKRGGNAEVVSLELTFEDGRSRIVEPQDDLTPDMLFQRQWALTVLQQAVEALEKSYSQTGKASIFKALRFVIAPGREQPRPFAEVAAEEGMSESAVKVAAHRLRDRYGKQLREIIADTVLDQDEVEEEMQVLMSAFG